MRVRARIVPQADLTPEDDVRIARLLDAAFPDQPGVFVDASYAGAKPDHRVWIEDVEDADGPLLAHLGLERRVIGVGSASVVVGGVGGFAVRPDLQDRGFGRLLNEALFSLVRGPLPVAFGVLTCGDGVSGFFETVGWTRIAERFACLDATTLEPIVAEAPLLVLPALSPLKDWPPGEIDLKGLPW